MRTIWMLTGGDNIYHSLNHKMLIYKAIGTQYFVDSICDSDYLSLIALKALYVIASGPPVREKPDRHQERRLIKGTEEMSRAHAIPAVIRLLKTRDEIILSIEFKLVLL